ncbi:MAG: hypothetical protein LUI39_02310 [Lachnospiraceae bacterium]|nr:hypothetical protein [Lachnospiraceae bacterium]
MENDLEKKEQRNTVQEKASAGNAEQKPESAQRGISETWAEDTIADLDDYIESQGIYLRQ